MREMKDSGLEWLGNVSSDVKLVPLKYLLKKERANKSWTFWKPVVRN